MGLSTEGPPQIVFTKSFPIKGISEKRLVITETPQNLIWLTGRTYPMKAAAMVSRRIVTPIIHVWVDLNELK